MAYMYVVLAAAACYLLYHYVTRTFGYWKKRRVNGPPPVPLFGSLQASVLRKQNTAVVFRDIYKQFPNDKIVGMYRMTTPCLLVRDLDIAKTILIKDFDCFSDRGVSFSERGLGNNLFHADTHIWRVLRNRFTPIFTSTKLKNMVYLMEQSGDRFVEFLRQQCAQRQEQELHALIQRYTVATISACAFGLDFDTITDKIHVLQKLDNIIFSPSFIDEVDMMYPGILKKLNLDIFPKEISDFFDSLVTTVVTQRNGKPTNRKDFMDLILELRQQGEIHGSKRSEDEQERKLDLTDDIIAAQAFVFYAGGYETSASTMSFMLYEMARNPDLQDRVIQEVDDVMRKYDGKLTFEALNELKYMEQVFDETLRLYPIVDPLQRRAQKDYQIPGTDVTVEAGQMVFVTAAGIHRDERYYPDPERFDPERFSPENSSNRHPCAYLPFGVGPRNCIGMRFSKIQSRMCMAKFFSSFRVSATRETLRGLRFVPRRFILGSDNIKLNIIPRKL
ncbi:PREDICTED: cytochrome P450 6B5-like [Papilio polytes]|uniref:cytochrome P450 6B5-like n=1 Tax=Papilio polytes TaxID=76194 RepID=UPI0006760962|nr:PREDICTED: cytochrome P450 6B5-like [Papilio polytes]